MLEFIIILNSAKMVYDIVLIDLIAKQIYNKLFGYNKGALLGKYNCLT